MVLSPRFSSKEALRKSILSSNTEECESILDSLPPTIPGDLSSPARGVWKVAYAPHIEKVRPLVRFDPILYDFVDDGRLESHVRYESKIFGTGWLSTRGIFETDDTTATIEWNDAWVDPGSDTFSPDPSFLPNIVTPLARLGFVKAFSTFPVQYLDKDLCVFLFPLTKTRIVAFKQ